MVCVATEARHLDRPGELGEFEQEGSTSRCCRVCCCGSVDVQQASCERELRALAARSPARARTMMIEVGTADHGQSSGHQYMHIYIYIYMRALAARSPPG